MTGVELAQAWKKKKKRSLKISGGEVSHLIIYTNAQCCPCSSLALSEALPLVVILIRVFQQSKARSRSESLHLIFHTLVLCFQQCWKVHIISTVSIALWHETGHEYPKIQILQRHPRDCVCAPAIDRSLLIHSGLASFHFLRESEL